MLLTHHPLIFKAIKKVNDQNFITRRLVKLIQADISYYAMHTNFDAAPGCMADLAAERLSLKDTEPLECMGNMEINGNPVAYGIGKTGNLAGKLTVKALAEKVKQAFDLPFVLVYGEETDGHGNRKKWLFWSKVQGWKRYRRKLSTQGAKGHW